MKDELIALEEEGWHAMSSTGATDYYEKLLAQEALMVVPRMVVDRSTFLQALRSETPWSVRRDRRPRTPEPRFLASLIPCRCRQTCPDPDGT